MVQNIKRLFLVTILLFSLVSGLDLSQAKTPKAEIVDANHFFSETSKEKSYNVNKVQKDKPLVVMLRKIESNANYDNKVSLSLKSGKETSQCHFQNFDDLCVFGKPESTELSMTIKCSQLPCDVEWDIYQSQLGNIEDTTKIAQLYKIHNDTKHMVIMFTCNKAESEIKNFDELVSMHSNVTFGRKSVDNSIYYYFDQVKEGYIYVNVDSKAKSCVEMKVKKIQKELNDNIMTDYLKPETPSVFELDDLPSHNFRVEMAIKTVNEGQTANENNIYVRITGEKNSERKTIRNSTITFGKEIDFYNFNYIIPKIDTSTYSKIRLQISSNNPNVVDLRLSDKEVAEVEGTEHSYFDLKKGEKVEYKLIEEPDAEDEDVVHIYPSDDKKIKLNETSCKLKPGCLFNIEALEDVNGRIYLGGENTEAKEIIILDFKDTNKLTRKIRDGEKIYIKKKLSQKAEQVVVNTGNVMVYASNVEKCKITSEKCYEKVGNIHSPFFYEPGKDGAEVMFMIKGLDNSQFTITLIQEGTKYIELNNSEPFAYTFDDNQNQLKFTFKNTKKDAVNFNLIAPVNTLNLFVSNGNDELHGDEDDLASSEGFIQFQKKEVQNQDFSILVKRIDDTEKHFVHFTLVASTGEKSLRLEPSVTHYETLNEKGHVDYVFEFNSKDDYVLNFYTHNVKQEDVNITLLISATEEWDHSKGKIFTIDKSSDVLLLNQIADQVCLEKGESTENCELWIRLVNAMDMQIDITITLMTKHSVIELKDGLWQTFSLNSVAETSHFFFYPQHRGKDVNIIYKSSDSDLRLVYKIFAKFADVSPGDWPFPNEKPNEKNSIHSHFKPVKHVSIHSNELRDCWPSCIVLMSLISFDHKEIEGNFSLMATNNILEIPAKEKIDATLNENEEKSFLVDLKYAIDKEQDLIFYIYHTIGYVNFYGSIYSEKNPRIPEPGDSDFQLKNIQTTISINRIKQIIQEEEMDEHLNIYLYLVAQGYVDSKISIEYDYKEDESDIVKMLDYDTFETVKVDAGESKYFHLRTDQDYEIKLVRLKGFPFVNVDICQKKDVKDCMEEFQDNKEKGKQLLSKTQIFKEKPCPKCIGLAKVSAVDDPAEVQMHVQSKFSEIQMTEGKVISDFIEGDEKNSYMIYAIKGEEIVVNIHVTEGEVDAYLTDFTHLNMVQKNSDVLTFVIPGDHYVNIAKEKTALSQKIKKKQTDLSSSKDLSEEQRMKQVQELKEMFQLEEQGSPRSNALSEFTFLHKFIALHLTIKAGNSKVGTSYTVSYSSGARQVDLQDGLIMDYTLEPEKPTSFYYSTASPGHAFLTISMQSSSVLSKLSVKMKYCDNYQIAKIDDSCWVDIPSEKPPIKKKTPNPTIMYSLPARREFQFTFENKADKQSSISVGINHQEVVLLPYNHEFPFVLHPKEENNFLIEVNNPGYLTITLRKCDESEPTFGYTFDYESFQNKEYTYEATLEDDPKYEFKTKTKEKGTLYIHIESPKDRSLLSLKVTFSPQKVKDQSMKAGNKGLISYSIVDSQNAQFTFSSPLCESSHCSKKIKYSVMTAPKLQDLYTQLVCPASFFSSYDSVSIPSITQEEISPKENSDGTLSFQFKLVEQISYVGVKATTTAGEEIYYKPIQVATLWGQLARTSHGHKLAISSVLICFLMGVVICVRRNARQGYKRIDDDNY